MAISTLGFTNYHHFIKIDSNRCVAATKLAYNLKPFATGEMAGVTTATRSFTMPDLQFSSDLGNRTISGFAGRNLFVNIWASWCVPCREEMPSIAQLASYYKAENIEFLAIDADTSKLKEARQLFDSLTRGAMAYYHDKEGKILFKLKAQSLLLGLPATLLVAPDGCLVAGIQGPANWSTVDARRLLSQMINLSQNLKPEK